jgi:hypothetical protein
MKRCPLFRLCCAALQCAVTVLLTFSQTIVRADLAQSSARAIWFRLLTSAERDSGDPCRYFTERDVRARRGQVQTDTRGKLYEREEKAERKINKETT